MKDKQWKDFWDVDLGVSYIPIDKLDPQVDMVTLEDGGTFDEDTMPEWMKTMRGVAPNLAQQLMGAPAVPGQFMGMPDGLAAAASNPLLGVAVSQADVPQVSVPPNGPPPGLPPFGLPPGPPPGAGLLGAGSGMAMAWT